MKLRLERQLQQIIVDLEDGDPERPLVRWDVDPLGVLDVVPRSLDYLAVEVRPQREGVVRICAFLLDRDAREERCCEAHYVRVHPDMNISTAPVSASMSVQEDPEQPTQGGPTGG